MELAEFPPIPKVIVVVPPPAGTVAFAIPHPRGPVDELPATNNAVPLDRVGTLFLAELTTAITRLFFSPRIDAVGLVVL